MDKSLSKQKNEYKSSLLVTWCYKNHKVTIWPEQGIGDFILMSRFLNDLKNATNKNFINNSI